MIEDFLSVWRILHYIDKDRFFEITQFKYDYRNTGKWIDYQSDHVRTLLGFDDDVKERFNDYIKENM